MSPTTHSTAIKMFTNNPLFRAYQKKEKAIRIKAKYTTYLFPVSQNKGMAKYYTGIW